MPIRTGILSVGPLDDEAIAAVIGRLQGELSGVQLVLTQAIGSQRHWIADTLMRWCDEEELDFIVTLGGSLPSPGPSAEEITPEATGDVLERSLPALPEAMRRRAAKETPLALLDRGVAGIRGRTLILNLPAGAATPLLFLDGVIDVLPACFAHLNGRPDAPVPEDDLIIVEDEIAPVPEKEFDSGGRLDATEFEAFRRRRREP